MSVWKGRGGPDDVNNYGPNLPVNFSIWNKFRRNETQLMGYTVRTEMWRFTEWFEFNDVSLSPIRDGRHSLGVELYDHRGDTGLWLDWPEATNLAGHPEFGETVSELHAILLAYIRL